mmetsp:Transcript_37369/g.66918  ORF Transcript_37369/g.66918 Transcript_37369/m.66918 type:complete len:104 (+) Transcript_37369:668-979(+)
MSCWRTEGNPKELPRARRTRFAKELLVELGASKWWGSGEPCSKNRLLPQIGECVTTDIKGGLRSWAEHATTARLALLLDSQVVEEEEIRRPRQLAAPKRSSCT